MSATENRNQGPPQPGEAPAKDESGGAAPKLSPTDLDSLRAKAASADDFQDRWLRVNAELQNIQRRNSQNVAQARRLAVRDVLAALIPSFDNLGRALSAPGVDEKNSVAVGVRMVSTEIQRILGELGVTVVDPLRERLDPNFHEAVARKPDASVEENTILEVHEKGYRLADLVIRPARVVVATRTHASTSQADGAAPGTRES